jgi:hypothetical protein
MFSFMVWFLSSLFPLFLQVFFACVLIISAPFLLGCFVWFFVSRSDYFHDDWYS